MGQKVNPISNRIGIIRGWDSNWYGGKDYSSKILEDTKIRQYLEARLASASLSKIVIERTLKLITVTIHTARPGIIIGKGGSEVEKLKEELKNITKKDIQINIYEVKRPEADANIVAQSIARQVEGRVSYRRAIKMAVSTTMYTTLDFESIDESYLAGPTSAGENLYSTYKGNQVRSVTVDGLVFGINESNALYNFYNGGICLSRFNDMMKKFGVNIGMEADSDSKRIAFDIHGGSTYKSPKPFKIERDWSAAAMMICIGAIAGKIRMKGLSFNSHQPDSIIIPILCRCGADIELQGFSHNIYQTFSATTINRSLLIPFAVDITDIPDLFPALFILALRCAGPSVIQGISRLRNKESDRAATFFKEFTKLGVKMEIKDEEMTIWGSPMMTVLGGKVSSHGDHRLAMIPNVCNLFR